jgi:hypothetical protein
MAATAHRHHAASGWVGGRRGKRRGGEAVVAACARQGDMPKKSVYEHEAKEANMFGKGATLGVVWARASVGGGCRSSAVQTTRRFIGSRRDMWLWPPTRHASRGGLSHRRGGNNEHARKKNASAQAKSEGVRSHAWQGPPRTATPPLTANHVRSCQHAWSPAFPSPTHRPPTPGGARVSEVRGCQRGSTRTKSVEGKLRS